MPQPLPGWEAGAPLCVRPPCSYHPASLTPSPCALQHGWEVANGRLSFKPASGDQEATAAAAAALPSLEIISHCLNYAREVERIV